MMTKHRIGRVELPWTNLEPPIRSPDYYINLEKRKAKKDAAGLVHADGDKSRRTRSVDLGSVSCPHFVAIL
jgi:delta8-fatty-acid desaturase